MIQIGDHYTVHRCHERHVSLPTRLLDISYYSHFALSMMPEKSWKAFSLMQAVFQESYSGFIQCCHLCKKGNYVAASKKDLICYQAKLFFWQWPFYKYLAILLRKANIESNIELTLRSCKASSTSWQTETTPSLPSLSPHTFSTTLNRTINSPSSKPEYTDTQSSVIPVFSSIRRNINQTSGMNFNNLSSIHINKSS